MSEFLVARKVKMMIVQGDIQDPKVEVPYNIRPYVVVIFPGS